MRERQDWSLIISVCDCCTEVLLFFRLSTIVKIEKEQTILLVWMFISMNVDWIVLLA